MFKRKKKERVTIMMVFGIVLAVVVAALAEVGVMANNKRSFN